MNARLAFVAAVLVAGCLDPGPTAEPDGKLLRHANSRMLTTGFSLQDPVLTDATAPEIGTVLGIAGERLDSARIIYEAVAEQPRAGVVNATLRNAEAYLALQNHLLSYDLKSPRAVAESIRAPGIHLQAIGEGNTTASDFLSLNRTLNLQREEDETILAGAADLLRAEVMIANGTEIRVTLLGRPPLAKCCSWAIEVCGARCAATNDGPLTSGHVIGNVTREENRLVFPVPADVGELRRVVLRSRIGFSERQDECVFEPGASTCLDAVRDVEARLSP